jgi:hypothetical protein
LKVCTETYCINIHFNKILLWENGQEFALSKKAILDLLQSAVNYVFEHIHNVQYLNDENI